MANWSDCEIIFIGEKPTLQRIIDEEEKAMDEMAELSISVDKDFLRMSLQGRWSGPSDWFKEVCEKYGVDGEYNDLESGCDFYHSITVKNGVVDEVSTRYFSDESVEYLGLDHFYADFTNCFASPAEAKDVIDIFVRHGEDRQEVIECLVIGERFSVEVPEEIKAKYKEATSRIPGIGESGERPCFTLGNFDVFEGTPTGPNGGWNVIGRNRETGFFEEREIVEGDFVLETGFAYCEEEDE